jgi:mitogen-activated protein kinase kinase kinase
MAMATTSSTLTVPPSPTTRTSPGTALTVFSSANADLVQQWDEQTVGEWLKSVNCDKYRQMFAKNNINGDALLDCDQNILKEVGVTKVGDRIRIMVAVKALRARAMSISKVLHITSLIAGCETRSRSFIFSIQSNNDIHPISIQY